MTDITQFDTEDTSVLVWFTVPKATGEVVCLPLLNEDRLNVSVPVKEINAGWLRWVNTVVIASIILVVAFILFFMRYTRRITKPLQDLTKVAEQIGEGNYDYTPDYEGEDEIGILTRTFGRVTKNLKTSITDLNDLNNRLMLQQESLTALLDNMPALNFSKDMETGAYLYCNQGFAEYVNKSGPEEVIGLTDYDIFDPVTAKYFEKVSLRFGVYSDAQKQKDVKERFTRAKIAADRVKDDLARTCGYWA